MSNTEPAPVKRPRARWKRILVHSVLALCILLSGICIGSGLTVTVLWRGFVRNMEEPGHIGKRIATRIQRKYDLDDAQKTELDNVFSKHQEELNAIRLEVLPRIETELTALKGEVSVILGPEKSPDWEAHFEKLTTHFLRKPKAETQEE